MNWIDVKSKMPKSDETVLIAHRKSTDTSCWDLDTAFYCSEEGEWLYNNNYKPVESWTNLRFVYYWSYLKEPK